VNMSVNLNQTEQGSKQERKRPVLLVPAQQRPLDSR
jgi:hypothetical protein